ncbi:hypothetical protein [Kitasatospora sp. NPDC093806]|uniref:hypothetical protein n=1 Tax=Kitasatospora sp. NPDC093806 TaxID=3155075 RepID=UPI003438E42C
MTKRTGHQAKTPRLRRICLVVDIEAYSGRPYRVQQKVQERLDRSLDHACARAGVDRARCEAQDRGDGQLLLLPPDVDEAKALPGLVLGLRDALHTLNRAPGTAGRLRVRAALAQGGVQRAALGYVARSVETACRLLDCAEARAALKSTPDTDLALVVADDLFTDAFAAGAGGLPVEEFTPITVAIPAKRFEAHAWVGTPRQGSLVPLPDPAAPAARRRATASVLFRGLGDALAGAAVGATPTLHHHQDHDPPNHGEDGTDTWTTHDGHHGHHGHDDGHHHDTHHHDGHHADDPWHPHDGYDPDPWATDPHHHQDPHHHDQPDHTPDDSHHHHDTDPAYPSYDDHHTHDPVDSHTAFDSPDLLDTHNLHDVHDVHDLQPDQGWHGPHH